MEKSGIVYFNDEIVGIISKINNEYLFQYDDNYFNDSTKKSISLTLPKTTQVYKSDELFPFFFNMLSEGVNKTLQCRQYKIDENDYFSLLLEIGGKDVIGGVSIKKVEDEY